MALSITAVLSITYLWLGTMGQPPEVLRDVSDTAIHGVGYGVLTASALATATLWTLPRPWALAAGYAVGHGALLESVQSATRSRRPEWRDLIWDAVGAAVAVVAAWAVRRMPCRS